MFVFWLQTGRMPEPPRPPTPPSELPAAPPEASASGVVDVAKVPVVNGPMLNARPPLPATDRPALPPTPPGAPAGQSVVWALAGAAKRIGSAAASPATS